jgi:hypothetical protein
MHSGDLGGQYYLEKTGSVLLGYESSAIRFKALARSSPAGFTLLSGLLNKSHLFLTSRPLRGAKPVRFKTIFHKYILIFISKF